MKTLAVREETASLPLIAFTCLILSSCILRNACGQTSDSRFDHSTVLVRLHDEANEFHRFAVERIVGGEVIWESRLIEGLCLVRLESGGPIDAIESLRQLSYIKYAELNYVSIATSSPCTTPNIPNDTLFAQQWSLNNTGQILNDDQGNPHTGCVESDVRAACAWTITKGEGQIIGVIDAGLGATTMFTGQEFAGQFWVNDAEQNGLPNVDDDSNGYKDDVHGFNFNGANNDLVGGWHGSCVTGLIGAKRGNSAGISGLAPDAKLMILKMAGNPSVDPDPTVAMVIEAAEYGALMGAKVLNISRLFVDYSKALYECCEKVGELGVVVVCGAGNSGIDIDSHVGYGYVPATFGSQLSNVITVAAVDNCDTLCASSNLCDFNSNYGDSTVLVCAPGGKLWTTANDDSSGNHVFEKVDGTSFATPLVSSVAAMVFSTHPTWTPAQVKSRIKLSARVVSGLSSACSSGGVVDAWSAVQP